MLAFIMETTEITGDPPTLREIGAHFGFNASAAQQYVMKFREKGFVQPMDKRVRSMRVFRINEERFARTLWGIVPLEGQP